MTVSITDRIALVTYATQRLRQPILSYYRHCLRRCNPTISGEDYFQELCIRLWGVKKEISPEKYEHYIWIVANNLIHDRFRRLAHRQEEDTDSYSTDELEKIIPLMPAPEQLLENTEESQTIDALIEQIPDKRHRLAFRLRFQYNLPSARIGICFGVTVSMVEKYLRAARTALKSLLPPEE